MANNTPMDGATAASMATVMNPDVDMSLFTGVPATNVPDQPATGRPSPVGPPNVEAPNTAGIETSPTFGETEAGPGRRPVDTGVAAPAATPPHPLSKAFDNIFKTMSGGPIYVNDPITGERREVPQTRGSMARGIVAAALAGLFTEKSYRPGAFGSTVLDRGNTAAKAFQAGKGAIQERNAQAQKTIDDQNTRKLLTFQNNAKQATMSAALAHQRGQDFDAVIDNNTKMLGPVNEAAKTLGADKVWEVPGGMTADEVLKSGHSLGDNNVIATGKKYVNDATGTPQPELTYGIMRNDFQVSLNEDQTKKLAQYDERFQNVYKATGGNVMLPINAYVDRLHLVNRIDTAESFLNRLNTQINGDKATPINLAAAYKKNPNLMGQAMETLEHDMAAGTGRDEGTDDNLVQAMRSSAAGTSLIGLLGDLKKTDDWAQDQRNDREEAYRHSISAGTAKGKYEYTPIKTLNDATAVLADTNQSPERRAQAQRYLTINENFKSNLHAREELATQNIRQGDANLAAQLILQGKMSITELKTRGATPGYMAKVGLLVAQNGGNVQVNEAQFKQATQPNNAIFFGSINSLTDPSNGMLDTVVRDHKALGTYKIPVINSAQQYVETVAGMDASNPVRQYLMDAWGASDDYAKVMGGGIAKEGQQLEIFQALNAAANQGQIEGSVQGMRQSVTSQARGRIGTNRLLADLWGQNMPGAQMTPRGFTPQGNHVQPTNIPPMSRMVDAAGKPLAEGQIKYFPQAKQFYKVVNGAPVQVQDAKGTPMPQAK